MDSELHFEWPEVASHDSRETRQHEWRPLARRASDRRPPETRSNTEAFQQQLQDARATIERLESDRRAARIRINELEAASDVLQARVTSQRRRLLVLERQLEAADMEPACEVPAPASWLDRLFGGLSSVPTG